MQGVYSIWLTALETHPHTPLTRCEAHLGKSRRGGSGTVGSHEVIYGTAEIRHCGLVENRVALGLAPSFADRKPLLHSWQRIQQP